MRLIEKALGFAGIASRRKVIPIPDRRYAELSSSSMARGKRMLFSRWTC